MSEEILRVLLSDLITARVQCQKCKAVVEVATENLASTYQELRCPCCRELFYELGRIREGGIINPFQRLSEALAIFRDMKDKLQLEFTVTQPTRK